MAEETVNVALGGDIDCVKLDEVRWGAIGWDFENLDADGCVSDGLAS